MATYPQPPQPPLPPAPPRTNSNIVAIVLLILALVVVVSGLVIWTGLRFLSRGVQVHVRNQGEDRKQVSIKTPFGGIEVNKNENITEAALGLPIYPRARRIKGEDSASISLGFPGADHVRIVAGKFETSDSLEKVREFYRDRLTAEEGPFTKKDKIDSDNDLRKGQAGNFFGVDSDGKSVFKIKRKDSEKVVALKSEWSGTRIELVRISEGTGEAN